MASTFSTPAVVDDHRGVAVLACSRVLTSIVSVRLLQNVWQLTQPPPKYSPVRTDGLLETLQVPLVDAHLAAGGMNRMNPAIDEIAVDVLSGDRAAERIEPLPPLPSSTCTETSNSSRCPRLASSSSCHGFSGMAILADRLVDLDGPALLRPDAHEVA